MRIIKKVFPVILSVLLFSSIFVPSTQDLNNSIKTLQTVTDSDQSASSKRRKFSAEQIMQAYQNIYPQRISEIRKINGDWTALIGDVRYYFSEGKFLPENELKNADKYSSYPFYSYSRGIPEIIVLDEEQKEALKARVSENDSNPPTRHPGFFNALWDIFDKQTSWEQVKTIRLFTREIEVHWRVLEEIAAIDIFLYKESKYNREVSSYIRNIESVSAYYYRNISGTNRFG